MVTYPAFFITSVRQWVFGCIIEQEVAGPRLSYYYPSVPSKSAQAELQYPSAKSYKLILVGDYKFIGILFKQIIYLNII